MMILTSTERRLVCALLHQYRLDLLRELKSPPPKSCLTDEGRERYWRDIELAESAAEKLEPVQPKLRAI